jgi:hypothetical protein
MADARRLERRFVGETRATIGVGCPRIVHGAARIMDRLDRLAVEVVLVVQRAAVIRIIQGLVPSVL